MRILPGGDYGFAWNRIGDDARDLEHFVKLFGFTPMEAIVAATRWGGEIMMKPGELGVIKEGALADLLLVDGDPVADIRDPPEFRPPAGDHEGRAVSQGNCPTSARITGCGLNAALRVNWAH